MIPELWWGVFFVVALLIDLLSVKWHQAREQGDILKATGLSAMLEALGWLPLWFALSWQDPGIAVASVVGSALGSYIGLKVQSELGDP